MFITKVVKGLLSSAFANSENDRPSFLTQQVHDRYKMRDVNMRSTHAIVRQSPRPDGLREMLKREHFMGKLAGFVWKAFAVTASVIFGCADQAQQEVASDHSRPSDNNPTTPRFL